MTSISIQVEKGEALPNQHIGDYSANRILQQIPENERTLFVVHSDVIQSETNAILTTEKHFVDFKSAQEYMNKFISVNPLSDIVLYSVTKKELLIYEEA